MRSITLFIILVFSFFMCACSEDSENSTGEAGMEQQMDAAPQDEMSSDMGADDMDPSDLVDMGEMPMDRGPMPEGEGELWRKFELLKRKLELEGLFYKSSKKKIPRFPAKIGLITSEKGAVLWDILHSFKVNQTFFSMKKMFFMC